MYGAGLLHAVDEAAEAFEAGAVDGEVFVEVAEEGHGFLQAGEGLDGLLHVADFDEAGKEAGGLEHEGEQLHDLAEYVVEAAEGDALAGDAPAVGDDGAEAVGELLFFLPLAVVEGDAFGVVADAHEGVAVVAVEVFVFVVGTDEGAAYPHGEGGGGEDGEVHEEDDAVGDFDAEYGQDAGQAPEDDGEFDGGDDGVEHAAQEGDGGGDEFLGVHLDALVDVVGGVAAHLQAVVGFAGEPAAGEDAVELFGPFDGECLVEEVVGDEVDRADEHDGGVGEDGCPEDGGEPVLHGTVRAAVQEGVEHVEPHFGEQEDDHQDDDRRRFGRAAFAQAGLQHLPEFAAEAGAAEQEDGEGGADEDAGEGLQQPHGGGGEFGLPFLRGLRGLGEEECVHGAGEAV